MASEKASIEGTLVVPGENDKAIVAAVTESNGYLASVKAYVIDSPEMFEMANDELRAIRTKEVALENERTSITKPMNDALKRVNAFFKRPALILDEAKTILSGKMVVFQKEERARIAAAEKLALEAQAKAREEADAIAAAAREAHAAGVLDETDLMEAETTAAIAAVSLPMSPIGAPVKAAGNAEKVRYIGTVTDMAAFLRHVAASLEKGEETFNNTVEVKVGQLNAFGNATKGSVPLPGVTWTKEEKIIARSN